MPKADPTMTQPPEPPLTSGKTALNLSATIDQLKKIAGEAMDHLIMSDGPPRPDYELLDLCGDILDLQKRSAAAEKVWRGLPAQHPDRDAAYEEELTLDGKISSLLCRARKLQATTAAGVFAKALVMRQTKSGAPKLALSLAEDLIATPSLRASIWPNEGSVA